MRGESSRGVESAAVNVEVFTVLPCLSFSYRLGRCTRRTGWEIAIPKMSKGQRAKLTISADLAYGERGYPPVIPSNATLVFDVDLISFG